MSATITISTTPPTEATQHTTNRITRMIAYFGENTKYFRKQKNIKQQDLAAALGVSITHLDMIEKAEISPSVEDMLKICLFLNEEFSEMLIPQRLKIRDIGGKRIKPFPKHGGRGLQMAGTQKADMDEIISNFGENLRKARVERLYNLEDFAGYVGISSSRLKAIEKGEVISTFDEVINICDFLGEDIVEMLMPQRIHRLILDGPRRTKPPNPKSPCELQQEMTISMILALDKDELNSIFTHLKSRKFNDHDHDHDHDLHDIELVNDFFERAVQRDGELKLKK